MPLSTLRSRVFLFTLVGVLAACTDKPPAAPTQAASEAPAAGGIHYGMAELPPPVCRLGDEDKAPGAWVEANGAGVQSMDGMRQVNASFAQALNADALRAVIDKDGLQHLARVEFQDADGWHEAWAGTLSGKVAQDCKHLWFELRLDARAKGVNALRFSFRPAAGDVSVGHAALHAG